MSKIGDALSNFSEFMYVYFKLPVTSLWKYNEEITIAPSPETSMYSTTVTYSFMLIDIIKSTAIVVESSSIRRNDLFWELNRKKQINIFAVDEM